VQCPPPIDEACRLDEQLGGTVTMQSKQTLNSNPRNRWPAAVAALATIVGLGIFPATRLFAGTTSLGPESRPQPAVAADPMTLHVADADKDVGPGGAESMLAQHPGESR
jgi:hypothetical protein